MSSRRTRKAAARAGREAAGQVAARRPLPVRVAVALAIGVALGFALRMLVESL